MDSVDIIVTWLQTGLGAGDFIPKRSDRSWGPPRLLFFRYNQGLFARRQLVRSTKLTTSIW